MKTFPQNWGTRHVSYFTGIMTVTFLLNGHTREDLIRHADESISASPDHLLLFSDLVERLEPHISPEQWDECVADCHKLFSRQPEAAHAK